MPDLSPFYINFILISIGSWLAGFTMRHFFFPKQTNKFGFRTIVRSFPDGLLILRDSQTSVILEMNTNAAKYLGYQLSGEVVGKKCDNIFASTIPCTEGSCEVRFKKKDGTIVTKPTQIINVNSNSMLVRVKESDGNNE